MSDALVSYLGDWGGALKGGQDASPLERLNIGMCIANNAHYTFTLHDMVCG